MHSVGVFMLISRAKVRPGAAGSDYSECSDWLLQIAALIRYASDVKSRERQMYLAVLAGTRTNVKHVQHVRRLSLIGIRKRDFDHLRLKHNEIKNAIDTLAK